MRHTMIKMQSSHPNGRSLAALLLTSILTYAAWSQHDASQPGPGAPPQPAASISTGQALYLVRSTLLTLNDANRSGNYTVLHDLAAPAFQARNTASDLAQIFADLRRRNFDLFSVALIAPQFTSAPGSAPGPSSIGRGCSMMSDFSPAWQACGGDTGPATARTYEGRSR